VDGETGFVVGDVDSMVEALGKIDTISPIRCRRHVEVNFDAPVMVEGYLRLYREIVGAPATLRETLPAAPVPAFYAKDPKIEGSATV